MYVVCPSCHDVFVINSSHLAVAQGRVRCGGCKTVFDATASLYDTLNEADAALERIRAAEQDIEGVVDIALAGIEDSPDDKASVTGDSDAETAETRSETESVDDKMSGVDGDFYAQPVADEIAPCLETAANIQDDAAIEEAPATEAVVLDDDPETERTVRISGKVWLSVAASVFLSVLITGQYIWKERYQLAADTQLRPWMERYCALLQCDLPLRSELGKIEILEREVRDHPRVKDALLVSATILNVAPFAQTYPVFEISFSDVSGTPVSVRRFNPSEYLSDDKDASQGFQPGEKTHLVLEVVDPGKQAVSFQFDFL